MENTEKYAFLTNNNLQLHLLKKEIQQQIQNFPIFVTADGYFTINRSFLAGVCLNCGTFHDQNFHFLFSFFALPLAKVASNCCTYIVIFIQFFLEDDSRKAIQ